MPRPPWKVVDSWKSLGTHAPGAHTGARIVAINTFDQAHLGVTVLYILMRRFMLKS
jgi:hypothetical protein